MNSGGHSSVSHSITPQIDNSPIIMSGGLHQGDIGIGAIMDKGSASAGGSSSSMGFNFSMPAFAMPEGLMNLQYVQPTPVFIVL